MKYEELQECLNKSGFKLNTRIPKQAILSLINDDVKTFNDEEGFEWEFKESFSIPFIECKDLIAKEPIYTVIKKVK